MDLNQLRAILHSVDRLRRLVDVTAPAIIIERERLLCVRHLTAAAPNAEVTRQAKAPSPGSSREPRETTHMDREKTIEPYVEQACKVIDLRYKPPRLALMADVEHSMLKLLEHHADGGQWISVTERLPAPFVDVPFVAYDGRAKGWGHRPDADPDSKLWIDVSCEDVYGHPAAVWDVTHWFDLPALPPIAETPHGS